MYIKINENNIFNYLLNNDIESINKKISPFIKKNIMLKCKNSYLNTINNLLLIQYIYINNDTILVVINIKNLNNIKIYKKRYFYDLEKGIAVDYNTISASKIIYYENKIITYYNKYIYSIFIFNNLQNHKIYKKNNIFYKSFVKNNIETIIYNLYYKKYNLYIKRIYHYHYYKNNKIILYNYINNKLFIIYI